MVMKLLPCALLSMAALFGFFAPFKPSFGAPVPKQSALDASRLRPLLGKNHLDKDVQMFRRFIKVHPVAKYYVSGIDDIETNFFHCWSDFGIEMKFDGDGKLGCIFLYVEPMDGYKRYSGELPAGLKANYKAADVKAALGMPEEAVDSESPKVGASWRYASKGLEIRFSKNVAESDGSVVAIVVLDEIKNK